ncbi:MAG TPA: hypothetical protein V6C76_12545 [Drouetiella sp.]
MLSSSDKSPVIEQTFPRYAIGGMEDAVVDVVVIRWIMHKLTCDRLRKVIRYITAKPFLEELS